MSGGHFDYVGSHIAGDMECIGEDAELRTLYPQLARVFINLGIVIRDIEQELDHHLSGDKRIANVNAFEQEALGRLRNALR